MKKTPVLCVVLTVMLLSSVACQPPAPQPQKFRYETDPDIKKLVMENNPVYPDAHFVVLSDIHYFAPELGAEGSAFQDYLNHDRKMLRESAEIFSAALQGIEDNQADFLILCGDLTKDGERDSHQQVAQLLQNIVRQGKDVYAVPGNHDIQNGHAFSYAGEEKHPVPSVTPGEFMDIYASCGFAASIDKDPDSLSYIAEPVPGLWLFALDSCRYRENQAGSESITGGRFYPATLQWIEDKLIEAIRKQKAVIGMMHHGILEHYTSNKKHYSDYLVEDFEGLSKMFAAYGMRFVFTGHYHAQDITGKQWNDDIPNHFLFDIETGSLVTYPVPWRDVELKNQAMHIKSYRIPSIPSHADDFQDFAKDFVTTGVIGLANEALAGYGVPEDDQARLSPQIAHAYVTHLQGDEITPQQPLDFIGVGPLGKIAGTVQGDLVTGWVTDLPPADNNITLAVTYGHP
jgi:3',5'-cyclic AMP phosphodiesterase CpdA